GLSESPVRRASGLGRRVALGEGDSFADDDLERDAPFLGLVGREAEDVPLDGAEPVGRPLLRRVGDPTVELLDARGHRLGGLACELVDLALVQRGQRLAGHVPLVEQEESRSARGAAAEGHNSSSIATSTVRTSIPHTWPTPAATCPRTSSA